MALTIRVLPEAGASESRLALIIGAHHVVKPVARSVPSGPIHGVPTPNADKAKTSS